MRNVRELLVSKAGERSALVCQCDKITTAIILPLNDRGPSNEGVSDNEVSSYLRSRRRPSASCLHMGGEP